MFKWKQIQCFDDCVKYVHFLGAIPRPKEYPTAYYQTDLCCLCDRINVAGGNESWFQGTFKSFHIHYTRKEKLFTVIKGNGISYVPAIE